MKYCPNCGAQLPDDAQFCGSCGTPTGPAETPVQPQYTQPQPQYSQPQYPQAQPYTQAPPPQPAYTPNPEAFDNNVTLCPDGIYRWVYELNMFKNTAILGTLFKIFGGIAAAIWLLMNITDGFSNFLETTKIMLIIVVGMVVLVGLSYLIVAAMNGGKYCVLFEMDETCLRHIQLPKQFKKAQVAGWIAMIAGAIAGNPTTTGAGILAASRNSLVSEFPKVRNIKAYPARNLIKVNAPFSNNQVYVDEANFQFVLDFIRSHCPKAS